MRQALFLLVGFTLGLAAMYKYRSEKYGDHCISARELKGCEETADDMLQSTMNCEAEEASCEVRWRACNEAMDETLRDILKIK